MESAINAAGLWPFPELEHRVGLRCQAFMVDSEVVAKPQPGAVPEAPVLLDEPPEGLPFDRS